MYRTAFRAGPKWVLLADNGAVLAGDSCTARRAVMAPEGVRAWLGHTSAFGAQIALIAFGFRYTEDGALLYMASGFLTDEFFDLFARVPRAAGGATLADNRRGNIMRRTLAKELLGFTTCDDTIDVQQFLRETLFPVRECA